MCGIAGILTPETPVRRDALLAQAAVLAHRGPDGEGVWIGGPGNTVGFAHRRLSIIDIAGGAQPMQIDDGAYCITYNGEIYNHAELRGELAARGVLFRTQSDTEVILQLYKAHGPACTKKLRGMFAFAIWDGREQRLFAARDRMGEKPFLYHHDQDTGNFIFASEAKAIFASGLLRKQANLAAMPMYLTYAVIPAPATGYRHVYKLPPGNHLLLRHGALRIEPYWQLRAAPDDSRSPEDWREETRARFTSAVKSRLVSDVPVGCFLSGGIDSSLICAIMARESGERVRTFSIGFREAAYNEAHFARMVAERYATEHQELIVEPDALALLPKMVRQYDEPYADSSCLPTFYLSEMTAKHVKVALSGDGGDELFGGYDRYYAIGLAARLARWPGPVRGFLRALEPWIPGAVEYRTRRARLKKLLRGLHADPRAGYIDWISLMPPALREQLLHPDFAAAARRSNEHYEQAFAEAGNVDDRTAAAYVDATRYLPDDLLVKADIATMTHSLEGRAPLMDHALVEFAFRMPAKYKMRGRRNKVILREVFGDLIPAPILARPKMGFGVPVGHWFRTSMKDYVRDILLDERTGRRGIFRREGLETLVNEHIEQRADHGARLWALLFAELWLRECVDAA